MNTKEQALYAVMENEGYSHGLIVTVLHAVSWSKEALDDLIIFIEDNHPTETQIIERTSEYLQYTNNKGHPNRGTALIFIYLVDFVIHKSPSAT